MKQPNTHLVLSLLRTMTLIREFEEAAGKSLEAGYVRGSVHQYTGQEAIATGVCAHLSSNDYVSSHHRGHGHAIAKGVQTKSMMHELFGREGGICNGKGGSMHIADFSKGMLGANGVVPDGVTIAVGAAHALKMQKRPEIVVAFFGDGAMNRGPLFEALNWAKLFNLPILFVCEDNGYSVTLKTETLTAGPGIDARPKAFGIPVAKVNGNDVIEVFIQAGYLIEQIKAGSGPQFLWATTYRWKGHLAHDKGLYRSQIEVEKAKKDDCIKNAINWLVQHDVVQSEIETVMNDANHEINASVESAKNAPYPAASSAFEDLQDLGFTT
jgi:pyruvate dehydrogenase E1 component alpha subunit